MARQLFTSESVSMGHPDKMCDQISDAVLDAMLEQDPASRVACETLTTTGMVLLAGEITTKAEVEFPALVRDVVRFIGYTSSDMGFDADTCAVQVAIGKQSPDISQGVTEGEGLHKEQGAERLHRVRRVRALRAHAQAGPAAGRERQQREDAAAVHPVVAPLRARHLDLGFEALGDHHELTRRTRVQPELCMHGEDALAASVAGHRSSSGRSSLATEMLRCP